MVALALHDSEGRWLMHRRPEEKHHGGLWEFPGGKVEAGETPAQALVREIGEELSLVLEIDNLHPASFAQEASGRTQQQIVILLYTAPWDGSPVAALEGGAIDWFEPEQIARLPKPPLDVALARSLLEKASD